MEIARSGTPTASERHPQFLAVIEKIFLSPTLAATAVRYLLIWTINLPGMRTWSRFSRSAGSLLAGRFGTTASFRSSLDHVLTLSPRM